MINVAGVAVISIVALIIKDSVNKDTLQPNSMLGFRTKATMRSPEAWKAGHQAAIPYLQASIVVGIGIVVLTLAAALVVAITKQTTPTLLMLVPALGLLIQLGLLIAGTVKADAMAKSVNSKPTPTGE